MAFCQQLKLSTLYAIWLAEHSTCISWAPLSRRSKAVAELPDRPWLTNTQARAETADTEPFKANHDLLFQPHYKMLQANSNSPISQSKPSYQL